MSIVGNLTEKERGLLSHLMLNGVSLMLSIYESSGWPQSTVGSVSKSLEDKGLIKRTITQSVRIRREFSLTLRGLILALTDMRAVDLDIASIRSHWGTLLPQVFGKWDHFREQNVEDQARNRLILTSIWMSRSDVFPAGWGSIFDDLTPDELDSLERESIEDERAHFTSMFYMSDAESLHHADPADETLINRVQDNLGAYDWMMACTRHVDLHPYFVKQLTESIRETTRRLESLQTSLDRII